MKIRKLQHWIKVFGFLIDGTLLLNSGRVLYFLTDWHTVDEDMLAILSYGAGWNSIDGAGITQRDIDDISNNADNTVASM